MCFIINKRYPKSKIAKKDIIVYKRIRHDFKPLVFSSKRKYVLNKEYLARDNKGKPLLRLKVIKGMRNNYIDEGVHSYKSEFRAFDSLSSTEILIECIIPKKTRYYENEEECVSKKIIPIKVLTKTETIKNNIFGCIISRPVWIK